MADFMATMQWMREKRMAAVKRVQTINDVVLYLSIFAIGFIGGMLAVVAWK